MWQPCFVMPTSLNKSTFRAIKNISIRAKCDVPQCSMRGGEENDEFPPKISANWREFRAALIAGSVESHEKAKQTAYRTGHWAHAVSCCSSFSCVFSFLCLIKMFLLF